MRNHSEVDAARVSERAVPGVRPTRPTATGVLAFVLLAVVASGLRPTLGVTADAAPGEFAKDLSTEPMVLERQYGDVAQAFRSAPAVVEIDVSIGVRYAPF